MCNLMAKVSEKTFKKEIEVGVGTFQTCKEERVKKKKSPSVSAVGDMETRWKEALREKLQSDEHQMVVELRVVLAARVFLFNSADLDGLVGIGVA